MITKVHHIGVNVSDIDRSMAFYRDLLGAQFVRGALNPKNNKIIANMQIGNTHMELLCPRFPTPEERYHIIHLGLNTLDLQEDAARMEALGCTINVPPRGAGSGSGWICFFTAPDNVLCEFIRRDESFLVPWRPQKGILGFDSIALAVQNAAKTEAFFKEHLHMREVKFSGSERRYLTLGGDLVLVEQACAPDADVFDRVILWAEDARKKAEEISAATGCGVERRQCGDVEEFIVQDPDGIRIALVDYRG